MDDPVRYAEADSFSRHDTSDLMNEFRDEMKAMHGKILDIGCGPATVTRDVLLPHLPDDAVIIGIDKSPEMIKYAEENHKDEKRLSFLQFDIESDKLPMNLFGNYDHAIAFFLFHWCQKTNVMLKNIYKLLRPGGTVLSISLSHCTAFEIYLKYEKNSKYSAYVQNATRYVAPHFGLPHPEKALKKDLEEAGFEVLHCSNRWRTYPFKNFNFRLNSLLSTTSFFNQMPEDLKEEYINDMTRIIREKNSIDESNVDANESPILEKHAVIVVYFRKPMESEVHE